MNLLGSLKNMSKRLRDAQPPHYGELQSNYSSDIPYNSESQLTDSKAASTVETSPSFEITRGEPFVYTRLVAEHAIRLLKVRPGLNNEPIECSMWEVDLGTADDVYWKAISYAWGPGNIHRKIQVNGKPLRVTASSYDALLNLRPAHGEMIVWIDAICINQADDMERGHQVQLMSSIYRQAECVLVWLGPATDDLTTACKFINRMGDLHDELKITRNSSVEGILSVTNTTLQAHEWLCVIRFFRLPWFDRLWTAQEVILGRQKIFRCGHETLQWRILDNVSRITHLGLEFALSGQLGLKTSDGPFSPETFRNLSLVDRAVRRSTPYNYSLPSLVLNFDSREATDKRDHIYGLLGLLNFGRSQEKYLGPNVDYSQSIKETYVRATRWCIQNYQDLQVLCCTSHRPTTSGLRESEQLPSWVPDFSQSRHHNPLTLNSNLFAASGSHVVDTTSNSVFIEGKSVLSLRGCIVDRIAATTSIQGSPSNSHTPILQWFNEASHLVDQAQMRRDEGFWRTLRSDQSTPASGDSIRAAASEVEKTGMLFEKLLLTDLARKTDLPTYTLLNEVGQSEHFGPLEKGSLASFIVELDYATQSRRFAITESGTTALVLSEAGPNDLICILHGGPVPFVIRPMPERGPDFYKFLGEAYVQGIMDGEALDMGKEVQTIRLV